MAVCARRSSRLCNELAAVWVHVATFAALWRSLKLRLSRSGQRFVTRTACDGAVRPQQGELRLAVVESVDIRPRPCAVAGLAAKRCAVWPTPRHAVLKLTMMGILMAGRTASIFEAKRQNLVRSMRHLRLMAIVARDGHVCAGQRVFRISMLCDSEERAVKILYGVAAFAAIAVRRAGKLPIVHVLMTVRAFRKLHLVDRVLAGRNVAFVAVHLCVLAFERVARCAVLLHAEQRWLPPIHGMTLGTLALLRSRFKLAAMSVLVAVHTIREGKSFLEVAIDVTCGAADRDVFAQQRILRLRVIKRKSRKQLLPSRRGVTFFAPLLERTPVRVHMAIYAGAKLHVLVSRGTAGHFRLMALFASHLNV